MQKARSFQYSHKVFIKQIISTFELLSLISKQNVFLNICLLLYHSKCHLRSWSNGFESMTNPHHTSLLPDIWKQSICIKHTCVWRISKEWVCHWQHFLKDWIHNFHESIQTVLNSIFFWETSKSRGEHFIVKYFLCPHRLKLWDNSHDRLNFDGIMCRDCMSVAQEWKLGVIRLDKSTENEVATHPGHVTENGYWVKPVNCHAPLREVVSRSKEAVSHEIYSSHTIARVLGSTLGYAV